MTLYLYRSVKQSGLRSQQRAEAFGILPDGGSTAKCLYREFEMVKVADVSRRHERRETLHYTIDIFSLNRLHSDIDATLNTLQETTKRKPLRSQILSTRRMSTFNSLTTLQPVQYKYK